MAVREYEQMERLDAYWRALEQDPATVPLAGLEADLAQMARRLVRGLCPPEPREEYVTQLRRALQTQAAGMALPAVRGPDPAGSPWWRLGGRTRASGLARLATAALVVAVLVAALLSITRPQAVSAQAILEKAQAAAASPSAAGLQSFVLTEVSRAWRTVGGEAVEGEQKQTEEIASEWRIWYDGPDRWRSEYLQRVLRADGTEVNQASWLQVSDGQDLWHYDAERNAVTVNRYSGRDGKAGVSPFGQGVSDLDALLEQAGTCYKARVTGSATVAGRAAHVIDLGSNRCPSTTAPEMNGRRVIWVDKETFFVLRQEQYSAHDGRLIRQDEVTSVQYSVPLDEALFTFAPPAGSSVLDGRPLAVPTLPPATKTSADPQQAALVAALEPLARVVDYPLFVPAGIPEGLAPRLPRLQPSGDEPNRQLWLEYAPVGEVELDSAPALRIVEQRAVYEDVQAWTSGAIPIRVPDGQAWVHPGTQDVAKGGSDAVAIVLRDGTLISVSGSTRAPEELLAIATSLQPVPGGHAPLPEPQVPAGAATRIEPTPAAAIPTLTPMPTPAFRVLRPTWLPEAMTVHEQVEGDIVLLGFVPEGHGGTGGVLTLREVPLSIVGQDGSPDPQASQETIGGQAVTVIRRGQGCVTYTWDVNGLRLTLSNVYVSSGELRYSCEDMHNIVESVR